MGVCGVMDNTRGVTLCPGMCMARKLCIEDRKSVCLVMSVAVGRVVGHNICGICGVCK